MTLRKINMELKEISLVNFRNYEKLHIHFSPGINVLIGENAQGKTSLLEAIYMLSLARSHRMGNDRDVIRWQSEFALIEGRICRNHNEIPLKLQITKQGKSAKVNHLEQHRLSDYIGNLNVILFAPEDLELVKGPPQFRRKFIDMELSQMSPIYLHESVKYTQILKQRNRYLKQMQFQNTSDQLYIEVLTEQLVTSAVKLITARLKFIDQLEQWAKPIHAQISRGREILTLNYHSSFEINPEMNETEIFEKLMSKFNSISARERERGTTLAGPHRDDLSFAINGKNVQKFGSQGQQRTTVLSLKLAEIECMKIMIGEYPILLLDDVLSELDDERQTHLLQSIETKVQTFLTTTSLDGIQQDKIDKPTLYHINDGQIIEESG